MVLTVAPMPYSNLAFLEWFVKAVATNIAGASNTTLKAEKVVNLVHWVKGVACVRCYDEHPSEPRSL
jgi:hypothetical protein